MPTIVHQLDDATSTFVLIQPRLFKIAYRVLASVTDAEDIVQEAWLRWQRTDRTVVENPAAFLVTTTTRLALNSAMSARRRHETCVGLEDTETADFRIGTEADVVRRDDVAQAAKLLLQKLTPMERATFILRRAFDYPHQRIAEILRITPDYSRQLAVRAERSIAAKPPRPISEAAHRRLTHAFLTAAGTGNVIALEQLLAADATHRPFATQAEDRDNRSLRRSSTIDLVTTPA